MSNFFPVSADRAAEAYSAALLRCQQYRFAASARRAVAAAFDGAYCTKALEPKFSALFPGDRVHYYSASYSGDKFLIIGRTTATGARLNVEMRLCRKCNKRINAAELIETAEDYEQRLSNLEAALKSFYANIQQYNVLCGCFITARDRVADVINCLDQPGSF